MTNTKNVSDYNYDRVSTKEKFQNDENDEDEESPAAYGRGERHNQIAILFATICVLFITRGHLGVTIVAMANTEDIHHDNTTNAQIVNTTAENANVTDIFSPNSTGGWNNQSDSTTHITNTESMWNVYRTYNWKKSVQEMALGSFFLGYAIMMFPIGIICQRWGGKIPLQVALIVNGVLSLVMPWLVLWGGWKAVCVCRVMQGMSQSGCFPCTHTLLAKWAPLTERARFASYAFSGTTFGTIIAFQVAGFLCGSSWGWPSVFWMSGVLCFLMFGILTMYGAATPRDHKTISAGERNFILGKIDDGIKKVHKTPWKSILTSKHAWAAFAAHVGSIVSFVFFFTQVPSYLFYILRVNMKNNGLLSSLPYCASMFSGIGSGILSDFCTNRKLLSLNNARKFFNILGQVGPAIFFVLLAYTTDTTLAVICLILLLSTHSTTVASWMINYIDLAPNFSGSLMAAGNTLGNIITLLLPITVSLVVTDVSNQLQWRVIFFLMSGMCFITNTIFMIFMTTEQQSWNDLGCSTDKSDSERQSKEEETKIY